MKHGSTRRKRFIICHLSFVIYHLSLVIGRVCVYLQGIGKYHQNYPPAIPGSGDAGSLIGEGC